MDFKALHYVIAVAENGSVSAAARKLGISQPSLTAYIANLSQSLGVALFDRVEGKFVPTYAGERFVVSARQILSMAKGLDHIKAETQERRIRVTCPPFEGSYINPYAVWRFRELFPDIGILMLESNDMAELLRSGQADVAVTSTVLPGKGFVYTPLVRDEILLVTQKNHPVGKHATWKENCSAPWVDINLTCNDAFIMLYPYQQTRILSDALLQRERITPRILMQTRSVLTSIRMASSGAAVCFAPAIGTRYFRFAESPAFYSVGDPVCMDVNFVRLHGAEESEELTEFMRLLADFSK
jgi:Transcriptional regulator